MSSIFGRIGVHFGKLGAFPVDTVAGGGSYTQALKFNDARNSQYLPLLAGFM